MDKIKIIEIAKEILKISKIYRNIDSENLVGIPLERINDIESLERLIYNSIQNERIEAEHKATITYLHKEPKKVSNTIALHIEKLKKIINFKYSPVYGYVEIIL